MFSLLEMHVRAIVHAFLMFYFHFGFGNACTSNHTCVSYFNLIFYYFGFRNTCMSNCTCISDVLFFHFFISLASEMSV